MKQEEFIERLSQIAELTAFRPPTTASQPRSKEDLLVIERQGEQLEIDPKHNPTWAVIVKKFKPVVRACEDCGNMVKDRRVQTTLYSYPKPHWRSNCVQCRKTQDPETKQFDIPTQSAQPFFTAYLNKRDK
ncbi:hypothetical protein UFOVP758_10 [uncultured Caudovirales phage]|uniref:Uncharacterized protein n=1 Tax=uncultured Caudovirales phage TaxID=2100421 RepID=A0A6J7X421_9CAUD|nr:hypothetical protein UFOVP758_10 [uncultured Caudovirales phage]